MLAELDPAEAEVTRAVDLLALVQPADRKIRAHLLHQTMLDIDEQISLLELCDLCQTSDARLVDTVTASNSLHHTST